MGISRLRSYLLESELGASMLEYALLACLIALVAMTGVARVGDETKGAFVDTGITIRKGVTAGTGVPFTP